MSRSDTPPPDVDSAPHITKTPWCLDGFDTQEEWADAHGVNPKFLPWYHLDDPDPVTVLQRVGEYLDARYPTCKRVSSPPLYNAIGLDGNRADAYGIPAMCLWWGWWHAGTETYAGPYYANPEYPHDHGDDHLDSGVRGNTLVDRAVRERRLTALERAAGLGLPARVLVPAFGVSHPRKVRKIAAENGLNWGAAVESGKARLARTWSTILAWGDRSQRDLARAFGVPQPTLCTRTGRYAADFTPPEDPNRRRLRAAGIGDY